MLARTAANLYWMSRYLERAENLARVLEVNQGLAWLKAARPGEDMAAPLRLTDSEAAFAAQHGAELTPAALWAFLGFSAHPASIRSCLARARDNADAARDALTGEMWQAIHATWLGMQAAIDAPPADPALLHELLVQVLGNALKFSQHQPAPSIAVRTVPAERGAGWVAWEVQDNGAGFNPERAAGLFGIFQRLHRETEFDGVGAGLAVCRAIAERHGAHITATAAVGQGCTVRVEWPAAAA